MVRASDVLLVALPVALLFAVLLGAGAVAARAGEESPPPAPPTPEPGAGPAAAEPAPAEPAPRKEVVEARAAWAWRKAAEAYKGAILGQARILREAATTEVEKDETLRVSMEVLRAAADLSDRAELRFRDAFEASVSAKGEGDAWDPVADADLLATGLDLAARHALEADPARAVAIWDRLIATFPDRMESRWARSTWLPIALPSTGDFEAARTRLLALAEEVEEPWKPDLLAAVGDVLALEGDYAKAREQWEKTRALIPEGADRNDARGRLRGPLDLRLKMVGRPVPEIVGERWFGAEPFALAEARGDVLLLDLYATWCGPCLEGIPHLQELYESRKDKGLRVLAITREYAKRGVLPDRPAHGDRPALPRVLYTGTTREEYVRHLEAFRERMEMTYPIVLVGKEIQQDYPIDGLPTMFVVDRDGTVGFVASGGRREHLLRLAVDRRLGAPGGR